MSISVAASIGNMPFATGAGSNGAHLVYASNSATWWVFWLSSTTTLNAAYWNGTAWTTATSGATVTLPAAHGSEGRGLLVWAQTISTHDVFYAGFSTSGSIWAIRAQVAATGLTWSSASAAGVTGGGAAPYGPALGMDTSNFLYADQEEQGDSHGEKSTNADTGTAWTAAWGTDTVWYSAAGSAPSRKILQGAGGFLLFLAGNGAGPPSTDLFYRYTNANPTTTASVWGVSGNTAIGDWDAVAADGSTYIAVRCNRSTNKLEGRVGTVASNAISSWTALATVPTSGLTFPNATSGMGLIGDGSSTVYLVVIDGGTGNPVKYCAFTKGASWAAGTWGAWTTLEATSATRNSLSASPTLNASTGWVLWTETVTAGSQYSVVSGQLSTGGGGGTVNGSGSLVANAAVVDTAAQVLAPGALQASAALVETAAQVLVPGAVQANAVLSETAAQVLAPSAAAQANAALAAAHNVVICTAAPLQANAALAAPAVVLSPSGDVLQANAATGGATQQVTALSAPLVATAVLAATGSLAGQGGGSLLANAVLSASGRIVTPAAPLVAQAVLSGAAVLRANGQTLAATAALGSAGVLQANAAPLMAATVLLATPAVGAPAQVTANAALVETAALVLAPASLQANAALSLGTVRLLVVGQVLQANALLVATGQSAGQTALVNGQVSVLVRDGSVTLVMRDGTVAAFARDGTYPPEVR